MTGATGFIGRWLVHRLRAADVHVIALVRNRLHGLPETVECVQGDILEIESFRDAGHGCDRLYHLAAAITFDPRQKEALMRANGQGTENILAAARRWNVARSVVVSSASTIGLSGSPDCVLDEEAPEPTCLAANNSYMASKLAAERAAMRAANEQFVVIVNPTTVYGSGDRTLNSGSLVKKIARSRIVPVPPGGGNAVDVDDVVEGILAAADRGRSGRRYILGGMNLTFTEIFSTIADVTGSHALFAPLPRWSRWPMSTAAGIVGRLLRSRFITSQVVGDMFSYKYYSSARAKSELGWRAERSFRESVERAWTFYRENGLIC